MNGTCQLWPNDALSASLDTVTPACSRRWYAIRSRSRHEKTIIGQLEKQGIEAYLPTVTQARNWSDRRKLVETPLFPGYAFVRFDYSSSDRLRVLCTHGVVGFVGVNRTGIPIPDDQIHNIRTLLDNDIPCRSHAFLKVGQRVRVRGGALDGVEGILVGHREDRSLNYFSRSDSTFVVHSHRRLRR